MGQRLYEPAALPAAIEPTVVEALAAAHAAEPFRPTDARDAAHRTAELATALGLDARVLRGWLDLGSAELDHLFVVAEGRVLDAAMPVNDGGFLAVVRAWVAGDEPTRTLEDAAAALDLSTRVVGRFPDAVRYRGAPLWGTAA